MLEARSSSASPEALPREAADCRLHVEMPSPMRREVAVDVLTHHARAPFPAIVTIDPCGCRIAHSALRLLRVQPNLKFTRRRGDR